MVWRDRSLLPQELILEVNYLGGMMPTFALNFSRPGAGVVAQYYTSSASAARATAWSSRRPGTSPRTSPAGSRRWGPFRLIGRGDELPVLAFTTTDDVRGFNVFDVSRRLRVRGWLVPAYTFPENRTDLAVLRVVVRNGLSHDLADLLLEDLGRLMPELAAQPGPLRSPSSTSSFHH